MWPPSDTEEMFSYYSSGPHSTTTTTTTHCPSNLLHRPYNTHFYMPAVQRGSLLQSGGVYGGNIMLDSEAVHMFNQFLNPVQLQLEILQREEWMLRNLPGQNLGIPRGVVKNEEWTKLSRGPGGEYRGRGKGTGVFIPRTSSITKNIARTSRTGEQNLSSSSGKFSVRVDEKELNAQFPPLAGARTKQENQVHSHKNSGKRFETRKEAECHYQLPPELALPQEWTY